MEQGKVKKVKIWMFQNNLSGNANGHFSFAELPLNSTELSLRRSLDWMYYKIWNVKCLGVFESQIGNNNFPSDTLLKSIKNKRQKK